MCFNKIMWSVTYQKALDLFHQPLFYTSCQKKTPEPVLPVAPTPDTLSLKCRPLRGSFIFPMVPLRVNEPSVSHYTHRDAGVEPQSLLAAILVPSVVSISAVTS